MLYEVITWFALLQLMLQEPESLHRIHAMHRLLVGQMNIVLRQKNQRLFDDRLSCPESQLAAFLEKRRDIDTCPDTRTNRLMRIGDERWCISCCF